MNPIRNISRGEWVLPIAGVVLTLVSGLACYRACGLSLGYFLGLPILMSMFLPALTAGTGTFIERLLLLVGCVIAGAACWMFAAARDAMTWGEWAKCSLVLATFVLAIVGVTTFIRRLPLPPSMPAFAAALFFIAWLTWPIWLSVPLSSASGDRGGAIAGWLVPAHPLMAINSTLEHLGIWADFTHAYHLTHLGRDVSYRLPENVWPAVVLHGTIGLLTMWAGSFRIKRLGRMDDDIIAKTTALPGDPLPATSASLRDR